MCQAEQVIPYRLHLSLTPPATWVEMFISFRPYKKCPLRMDNEILVQRGYSRFSRVLLFLRALMGYNTVG